jgi:hypothetical protein
VRVRATGISTALSDRPPAAPRSVPRQKRSIGTSHCAGARDSYAWASRQTSPYWFDRECHCLSPEAHAAQFLEDLAGPWRKGNA